MATTLNTDVAVNLDITARRNDTFKMILTVKDAAGTVVAFPTSSGGDGPSYQGKMTIVNSSGDKVISFFSDYWRDLQEHGSTYTGNHPKDRTPAANQEGFYTGGTGAGAAIYFHPSTGVVTVNVPYNNIDFQSGEYSYDFQVYKYPNGGSIEYITWLYGKFTLRADITQA
tara:strand:+ start:1392 stop:1901 length:510 start_codon:yes stop_codon:yes gene_type:complete